VDRLDLAYLTADLEDAPTPWLFETLAHLEQIRRSDLVINDEMWTLAAIQDEAARATDRLSLELARRIQVDAAAWTTASSRTC
jgi:hypothetical protein